MPADGVRNPTMKCFEDKMSIFGFSSAQAMVIHDSLPAFCADFFFFWRKEAADTSVGVGHTSNISARGERWRGQRRKQSLQTSCHSSCPPLWGCLLRLRERTLLILSGSNQMLLTESLRCKLQAGEERVCVTLLNPFNRDSDAKISSHGACIRIFPFHATLCTTIIRHPQIN